MLRFTLGLLHAQNLIQEEETCSSCSSCSPDPGAVLARLKQFPSRTDAETIRLAAIRAGAGPPSACMRTCRPNAIVQQSARQNPSFFDRGGGFDPRLPARAATGFVIVFTNPFHMYTVFGV